MVAKPLRIDGRIIGPGQPCFVVAEAGVNHNGNADVALRLVDAASEAGADAVKFQTFKAIRLSVPGAPKCQYQKQTTGSAESQLDMLRRLELSTEIHQAVVERCRQRNIIFLSTPFDQQSADYLEQLGVSAFKIPSGEITNFPYLDYVARKERPMIVSTGMSSLGEVEAAVDVIESAGNSNIVLLHCVSNYPADPVDVNLRAMETLRSAFQVSVGYSDHTSGLHVALASVALGASVLEKHFTLDCSMPGPDHRASIESDELAELIRGIRTIELALGSSRKQSQPNEADTKAAIRKSLVAARDIPSGAMLTEDAIAIRRPGTGLPPSMLPHVVSRRTVENIPAGTLLQWEKLA